MDYVTAAIAVFVCGIFTMAIIGAVLILIAGT